MESMNFYGNTESEELVVPDYKDELTLNTFKEEQIISIIEILGYPSQQAQNIALDTHAVGSDRWTLQQLHTAFSAENKELARAYLHNKKLEILPIDGCQVVFIKHKKDNGSNEAYVNYYRRILGPFYPDKIQSRFLTLTGPDGKQLHLQTWDLAEARQFDQIFERHFLWISEQKGSIGPGFLAIKQELGNWLAKELGLEGINPQKEGFIEWYLANKISALELSFEIKFDENHNYKVPEHLQHVSLKVRNLTSYITQEVIIGDLAEYFLWLEEKGLNAIKQIKINRQKSLTNRALVHQANNDDKQLSNSDTTKLTERERALIHCYKDLGPIKRGKPMYNDYIALATPKKRLAYSNDSEKKANSLIKSIQKILPFLSESEKQQAENEMSTIESRFS